MMPKEMEFQDDPLIINVYIDLSGNFEMVYQGSKITHIEKVMALEKYRATLHRWLVSNNKRSYNMLSYNNRSYGTLLTNCG